MPQQNCDTSFSKNGLVPLLEHDCIFQNAKMILIMQMFVLLKQQLVAIVLLTGNLYSYTVASLAAVTGGKLNVLVP